MRCKIIEDRSEGSIFRFSEITQPNTHEGFAHRRTRSGLSRGPHVASVAAGGEGVLLRRDERH